MPPPCTRRTDSSRHRVRQYTDKLLSIQGTKYRSVSEERCKQSPSKSMDNSTNLAPIPEERYSMIEAENFSENPFENVKAKNEQLRQEFFKDMYNDMPSSEDSLKRKKQLISAAFSQKQQQTADSAAEQVTTQQLTPVNPLLSSSPRSSGSNSPITFTSCVKVQYKPKIVPNQPLYGRHQFEMAAARSKKQFEISRSQSTSGIFHAEPMYSDIEDENEENENPPPRPPLPENYIHEMRMSNQHPDYFLSLPRDWNVLARSASYSALLR